MEFLVCHDGREPECTKPGLISGRSLTLMRYECAAAVYGQQYNCGAAELDD